LVWENGNKDMRIRAERERGDRERERGGQALTERESNGGQLAELEDADSTLAVKQAAAQESHILH
jgi:hypothetical protein